MRPGAGRPVGAIDRGERLTRERLMARLQRLEVSGALAATSRAVLDALRDKEYWIEVIGKLEDEEDVQTIVKVLMFHQQMRDGRPAQQINVTSQSVSFTADELIRARGVARGLVAPRQLTGEVLSNELVEEKVR
jgi:hypothetical protein